MSATEAMEWHLVLEEPAVDLTSGVELPSEGDELFGKLSSIFPEKTA